MLRVNEIKKTLIKYTRYYKESLVAKWNNCLLKEGYSHPVNKPSLIFNWHDIGAISKIEKQS